MDRQADPVAELPSGTLTLVFTDIEGSTRLLTRLGDDYARVLADHRRLLRAAFAAHGARELGTEGDSCFVAFARARDAVAAVSEAQRALAAHAWPQGAEVRVRVGMHSSEPAVGPESLVGLGVHRAARICAAAHGGQVLLSSATRELLDDLPPAAGLRDLGDHRLKDLDRPQRLFQLVVDGLPGEFPPPRAAPADPLPPVPTPTVGRAADVEAVAAQLGVPSVRLLTLTGPGGVGKTRLAVEVARRLAGDYDDGVHFVALAPVADARDLAATIARGLGVAVRQGEPAAGAVARHLAEREALVVLDNMEHVLAGSPVVAELLGAAPQLTLLVTSREPTRLAAERVRPVRPLPVPAGDVEPADLATVASVTLFAERARARDPDFVVDAASASHVAEICRRLDGVPLALELAAARVGILTPAELAARLGRALDVLTGGASDAPPRQRTVRATIDWSFDLLAPPEREAFARLAAFPGGATLAAAEAVTGATLDTLESLLAKQLLVRRGERLTMLEVVREYAAERLAEDRGNDDLQRRLAAWCADVGRAASPELGRLGHRSAAAALEAELPNATAALAWAVERGEREVALDLAAAWATYWWRQEHWADGARWLDAVLACTEGMSSRARGTVLLNRARVIGRSHVHGREHVQRLALVGEALEINRAAGDDAGVAACLSHLSREEAFQDRLDAADRLARAAREAAERAGDDATMALVLGETVVAAATDAGVLERARAALPYLERTGSLHEVSRMANMAGYTALAAGWYDEALGWLGRALEAGRRMEHHFTEFVIRNNRGLVRLFLDDLDGAADDLAAAVRACRLAQTESLADETMLAAGALAARRDDPLSAARLAGAARRHELPGRSLPEEDIWSQLSAILADERARFGADRWDAAERSGAALTVQEAMDLALEATAAGRAPQNTGVSR